MDGPQWTACFAKGMHNSQLDLFTLNGTHFSLRTDFTEPLRNNK